jgi:putative oxidoreductase
MNLPLSAYRSTADRLTGSLAVPLLILRVVVGWLMILHGVMKINMGIGAFRAYLLVPAHMPATGLLSWLIPLVETLAGGLLVLGLLTRGAAALLVIEMAVTGFYIKLAFLHTGLLGPHGSGGAEVDLLYLAAALALVFTGPGALSIDALTGLERRPHRAPRSAAGAPAAVTAQ